MLNADQIAEAIESGYQDSSDGICVVPKPDLASIRSRGGASIDLRLGRWFQVVRQTRTTVVHLANPENLQSNEIQLSISKRHFVPFGGQFILHPGRFVLASTIEWIRLPPSIAGLVTGKSSLGRHGLIIETAAGVHPGFSGCLTLELANVGEVPLSIKPGMQICQVFFSKMKPGEKFDLGTLSGRRRPGVVAIPSDAILSKLGGSA